jgi:hypothetical protein
MMGSKTEGLAKKTIRQSGRIGGRWILKSGTRLSKASSDNGRPSLPIPTTGHHRVDLTWHPHGLQRGSKPDKFP